MDPVRSRGRQTASTGCDCAIGKVYAISTAIEARKKTQSDSSISDRIWRARRVAKQCECQDPQRGGQSGLGRCRFRVSHHHDRTSQACFASNGLRTSTNGSLDPRLTHTQHANQQLTNGVRFRSTPGGYSSHFYGLRRCQVRRIVSACTSLVPYCHAPLATHIG